MFFAVIEQLQRILAQLLTVQCDRRYSGRAWAHIDLVVRPPIAVAQGVTRPAFRKQRYDMQRSPYTLQPEQ
ncbi:hypothetical protein D3C78_1825720 [compost metagenome]